MCHSASPNRHASLSPRLERGRLFGNSFGYPPSLQIPCERNATVETRNTRTWVLDIKQLAWRQDIE